MAYNYIPVDRSQQFLLPPSMNEWLPQNHLVWFVIDVVSKVDTTELHCSHPNNGVGRPAYNPEMMLGLLIYAYCTGERSSRGIEKLCWSDLGYRVLCANNIPDHTSISRFRADFCDLAKKLFVDVLLLAKTAGATTVGVVALDGTKMRASAGKKANKEREYLEAEVEKIMTQAEQTDSEQDGDFGLKRGDELPDDLTKSDSRLKRLDNALTVLNNKNVEPKTPTQKRMKQDRVNKLKKRVAKAKTSLETQIERDTELAKRRALAKVDPTIKSPVGFAASPEGSANYLRKQQYYENLKKRLRKAESDIKYWRPRAKDIVNITDPESSLMSSPYGFVQGYNAQAVVNEDGIILGSEVSSDPNDYNLLIPLMDQVTQNLKAIGITEEVGLYLADAGYHTEDNLNEKGSKCLIAPGKSRELKSKPLNNQKPSGNLSPVQANEHKINTTNGRALYSKRQHMIEPVFGHTKANRKYRSFVQRGLKAVNAEWDLIMAAHNLTKLYLKAQSENR